MARSFRRTPIVGITTARSDKLSKTSAHKRTRGAARTALGEFLADPEASLLPDQRLTEDVWTYAKDGRQYLRRAIVQAMPKLLRK